MRLLDFWPQAPAGLAVGVRCGLILWLLSLFPGTGAEGQLAPSLFTQKSQSSDATTTNTAASAMDGSGATFSLTADQPGSFWMAALERPYKLTRIEIVNRPAFADAEMGGLALQLFNMDDQMVFTIGLTNPGPGGVFTATLPAGLEARTVWIGLPANQTNAAGNYRVGLAEVRVFGILNAPYGPEPIMPPTNSVRVWQSSDLSGSYPAANAVDGNINTFTHTADIANSYWMADLGRTVPLDRIEIVNRLDCCAERLANLVLRVFDGSSNNVSSAVLTNVGLGGLYTHTLPAGTPVRWIRIGLENNQLNGGNNNYVTVAEVRAYSGSTNVLQLSSSQPVAVTNNLASFKTSYMVRLDNTVAAASNANDDNYNTQTTTTTRTVDGYWEVDLGATYALYTVRCIAASGIGYRLTNAIVRLFDEAHDSVYAQKISGTPDAFDTDLNGPIFARYVRVGLEDKQRTDPAGGIEWYIGFREVEVFGRPTNGIGIISFNASTNLVEAGQEVTLSWAVADVRRVAIYPGIGSVGAYTETNGMGRITLTVSNSTEFILVASNAAGIFAQGVSVQVASNTLPVRISEFVADNKYSLKDGYGEASDWIELRNMGNTPVNLEGWGLSDDPANPMKWVFPATNIAPHGLLVVFASGRNTPFDPAGNLHASFRLEKSGGALLLSSPQTNLVDQLTAYPEQGTDLAYGRDMEGNWTFLEPTPGAVNVATTYLGWLKPLEWSHKRGFYETGFTLTLTNLNPGATVLYSRDGSEPSLPYTNGIPITGTTAIRAKVVRPGYKPARTQTKSFIFINDVITSPVLNTNITKDPNYAPRLRRGLLALPSISICVPDAPEYWEKEGSLEVIWPDGSEPTQVNCGIIRYGNAWTKYAKRSIRMKCRTAYGDDKLNAPLFNGFDRGVLARTSFDELDLRSGSQDMYERGFYMAERFVEDSMLEMGSLNPHGRFVHVYINGVYWGQYDCHENMAEHFLADYLGGKPDDYVAVRGNDNVGDNFVLGTPEPPNVWPWERVRSLSSSYYSVRPYLDVSHLIDFMLLWNYGNAESEFRACGPVDAGTGFKFWLADADGFLRINALGLNRTVRNGPGELWSGLIGENNSDFKMLLADRIYKHFFNNGALTPARLDARLAARMQEINDSLILECARWGYRTPASWWSAADTIRSTLFPTRTSELIGMFRSAGWYPSFDPPTFNQYGGVVAPGFQPQLSSSAGTIYYTLDGSDPRLPGGGISPTALVWSAGAVVVTQDLTISARVRNSSGQWSALAQPRFLVNAPAMPTTRNLLITEIHYNPAGSDEYEFIELYNAGSRPLDLSGVSLSNAVRFIFPQGWMLGPGEFVLVVESTNAFAQRYQDPASPWYWPNLKVAGEWLGALDNAGETISLFSSNGVELASISYKPGGVWPGRADGQGSSLELHTLPPLNASDAEVRSMLADGRNWDASSLYHGSPGRFDYFTKSVRINELFPTAPSGEDWIELLNTGSQPVSLANCALTDNLDMPQRYIFSNDCVLEPGQFLVLTSAQLGFAFGEMGENIALLQMSGSNIIRFLDFVDYPAAAPAVSFGLFRRADGKLDFTEMSVPTPGATNAPPRIGPLVFSEILFLPETNKAAFLELTSLSDNPLPLFDPDNPANTWIIDGIGPYAFPAGFILEPHGRVIICSTNPEAFRAQYGVGGEVPVFGPWTGNLDRDGETLRLLQPGAPRTNGVVPLYRVDHVSFYTGLPWPETAAGASLQKSPLSAYGNDPLNWVAGMPTPGASLAPVSKPLIVESPLGLTLDEGLTAVFTVTATGQPPLVYQWRFNGVPISGATNNVLILTNISVAQSGIYDVLVSSPDGAAMSAPAQLVVIRMPMITSQPASPQYARPGSNVTFTIVANGTGRLRYQWYLNGTAIAGATNATLAINSVQSADAGRYTVQVTDDLGTVWSDPAELILLIEPVIVVQPLGQTVLAGDTVTLSVTVTNTATLPVSYRWRRSGATFTNMLLNSTTCFLTITNVQAPYTNWSVVVSNLAKSPGFLSSNAVLTILSDTNANRLPDVWEAAMGFDPANPPTPDADPDGDGLSNREEYLAGTDPNNPASCLRMQADFGDGGARLQFLAVSNRTYTVLYRDSLFGGTWSKLADFPAQPTNGVITIRDPIWRPGRYYRLVLPAQP